MSENKAAFVEELRGDNARHIQGTDMRGQVRHCRICGTEFRASKYSPAKFCPGCRDKARYNTYQKPHKNEVRK